MYEHEIFAREFGGYSPSSEVYLAPSVAHFVNNSGRRQCILTALGQRGWSVDVAIKMVYIRGGVKFGRVNNEEETVVDSKSHPEKVVMKIEPTDHPAALKASWTLTSEERLTKFLNLAYGGIEAPGYYYNTKGLASFPQMGNSGTSSPSHVMTLPDRQIKTAKVRVMIPEDFPEELIGKRVTVELKCTLEGNVRVPVQENNLYVIAVA